MAQVQETAPYLHRKRHRPGGTKLPVVLLGHLGGCFANDQARDGFTSRVFGTEEHEIHVNLVRSTFVKLPWPVRCLHSSSMHALTAPASGVSWCSSTSRAVGFFGSCNRTVIRASAVSCGAMMSSPPSQSTAAHLSVLQCSPHSKLHAPTSSSHRPGEILRRSHICTCTAELDHLPPGIGAMSVPRAVQS